MKDEILGQKIKTLRKAKGLSQEKFAEKEAGCWLCAVFFVLGNHSQWTKHY